jgi:phosphoribosyl-ATP pyrophosphohydrolase/phosphoribosyl-AMP cyclohydrolase
MTNKIKFDGQGLIPAVIQDHKSGKVLMLAYMNAESLDKTIETGYTWFYSRSRQQLLVSKRDITQFLYYF